MSEAKNWAEVEFDGAQLGDERLNKRLVQLGRQRGAKPHASIGESCGGPTGSRAAYRFYDNERIRIEMIQAPHRQAALNRAASEKVVLGVQDTTQVDLSAHPHTAGVGYLQDLSQTGYLLHSTLMVTAERVPLGLLQQQVWVRDPAQFGKKHRRGERATAEKESQKWLTSLQALAAVQSALPESLLVSVGDSEADLYALFAAATQVSQAFLVRACRDRLIVDEAERHLWQHVGELAVAGRLSLALPRQANRPARSAHLSLRFARVELQVPKREKARQDLPHLSAWAILACEENPPAEESERIEWKLLTNVPTETSEQAGERVRWYSCRWVVEMFHKVLKSGCRLEERQFDDLDNIQRFLAVDSVVAWRVLYCTLLGRQASERSCEVLLEAHEWQALACFIQKTHQPPPQPPTLAEAITWIARLGGFTGSRKHPPGTIVLWRGFSRLADIAQAWLAFRPDP